VRDLRPRRVGGRSDGRKIARAIGRVTIQVAACAAAIVASSRQIEWLDIAACKVPRCQPMMEEGKYRVPWRRV
jgi:hypothetical protein